MAGLLEEKDAIREVMARYCFALDDGRFADMAALFTEDGTWHTFFGKATGRKAIAEFAAGLRAHRTDNPRAIHHLTNIVITLDGDTAKVRSNWTTVQNAPEGPSAARGSSSTARSTVISAPRKSDLTAGAMPVRPSWLSPGRTR
jgi:uncharacterized protein (TIGR02246 family)